MTNSRITPFHEGIKSQADITRLCNQVAKRLTGTTPSLVELANLAALVAQLPRPQNRAQQVAVFEEFLRRFPTRASAQERLEAALLANGYQPPLSQAEKRKLAKQRRLAFYSSRSWLVLRMKVLAKRGNCCECCGRKPPDVSIHVDHIKPRALFPDLELDESNLQVLCSECNLGKAAWNTTDWRQPA